MGIIRYLIFIILVFCVLNLSSQTTYDTIYFSGKKFVKHIVQGGESLRSISNLHKVKTSDVKEANELNKRLFYNQLLYIPIYLNSVDKELFSVKKLISEDDSLPWNHNDHNSTINIALLMPYYLFANDTMFNDEEDPINISDIYYSKSESALSFQIGVELAIDSLRQLGKEIVLHIFDTNQDSLKVREIVYSDYLNSMDIIIGPMYSSLFRILCERYGRDPVKILISPLSRENKDLFTFPAVYQISITHKVQAEILAEYLIQKKMNERIIIFNDDKQEGLASFLKYKFKSEKKVVESFQIVNANVDELRQYLVEYQNILLISKNRAFVSKMLGAIGSIDSVSTVFTFESIKYYDNLDITNLMELDVHIPNSRDINLSNDYDVKFLLSFEREFGTNIQKYTKIGYDIIMHFCGHSNVYKFKSFRDGYNENILAPIYHYEDYELVPVN